MLHLKDPLCFKESMLVSLEALSNNGYFHLKEFINSIPTSVGLLNLDPLKEIEDNMNSCINEFKKTKTYFWLREDFKNALYEVEIQINKKIS